LTPASAQAVIIDSASALFSANGFSHSTSRPAAAAARTSSAWVVVGVQTSTASTWASSWSTEPTASPPPTRDSSGVGSSGAYTRTRTPRLSQAGRWAPAIAPAPIMPTVNQRVESAIEWLAFSRSQV
jgi:hypothetical protein